MVRCWPAGGGAGRGGASALRLRDDGAAGSRAAAAAAPPAPCDGGDDRLARARPEGGRAPPSSRCPEGPPEALGSSAPELRVARRRSGGDGAVAAACAAAAGGGGEASGFAAAFLVAAFSGLLLRSRGTRANSSPAAASPPPAPPSSACGPWRRHTARQRHIHSKPWVLCGAPAAAPRLAAAAAAAARWAVVAQLPPARRLRPPSARPEPVGRIQQKGRAARCGAGAHREVVLLWRVLAWRRHQARCDQFAQRVVRVAPLFDGLCQLHRAQASAIWLTRCKASHGAHELRLAARRHVRQHRLRHGGRSEARSEKCPSAAVKATGGGRQRIRRATRAAHALPRLVQTLRLRSRRAMRTRRRTGTTNNEFEVLKF